jgi:hypothetical protein
VAGPANDTAPTTLHHHWLHQGRDLCVSQQCRLPYDIKPFKDEVLCDISPLEVCDVILGNHICGSIMLCMSLDPSVIITLGRQLYKIPEVAPPTVYLFNLC